MAWSDIKDTVKDTIWRPDVTDAVLELHCKAALKQVASVRDWHDLRRVRIGTDITTNRISAPADFGIPESLTVLYNGDRIPLTHRKITYLRALWPTDYSGVPSDYSYHADCLWIAPAPSTAYDFELIYQIDLNPTSDTYDTTFLTTCEELIVLCAAYKVLGAHFHDGQAAQRFKQLYDDALAAAEDLDDRKMLDDFGQNVQPDLDMHVQAYGHNRWSGWYNS